MSQFTLYILNIVLIAIEVIIYVYLFCGFHNIKHSTLPFISSVLILSIAVVLCFHVFTGKTVIQCLSFLVCVIIWSKLEFGASILESLFISTFYVAFIKAVDDIFITVAVSTSSAGIGIMSDPLAYYMLGYGAKIIELLCVSVVHIWASHKRTLHQSTTASDWFRLLIFPLVSVAIAIFLSVILLEEPILSKPLFICVSLLMVSDLFSVFLLSHLERQNAATRDYELLQQNLRLETEHISAMQEAYGQQRKLTHDFKNHVFVLKSLIRQNTPPEKLIAYLDRIAPSEDSTATMINTHRPVVDAILSHRMSFAKSKNIRFDFQLDDLSSFPLSDDNLVVVLSNLIDNAIEACDKIPQSLERRIQLKMLQTDSAAFININNTTSGDIHIKNNRVLTTKKRPMEHGFGLRNVISILENSNGTYAIEYDPETMIFSFSAQIVCV